MSARLTNKELLVLAVLRDRPGLTISELAEDVSRRTPCPECGGSGAGDADIGLCWDREEGERGCGRCWGRGYRTMRYSTAYQALAKLRAKGEVWRRCKRDEWGDELATHVYFAGPRRASDDPLERAFRAPPASEPEVSP